MNEKNPLFILAGNGSYYNRGCEAITRGTVQILRNFFDEPRFIVVTAYKNEEQFSQQRLKETDPSIIHEKMHMSYRRYDFHFFVRNALMIYPKILRHITYKYLKPYLGEAKAVLALGGDNYTVDYGRPRRYRPITALDNLVTARGKPMIIWGASVGPFSKYPAYERYMIDHLRKVYIFARETSTIEYLAEHGLTENVHRVVDPAFLMKPVEPDSEICTFEIEEGSIGLNLSPLMKDYVTGGDMPEWKRIASKIINKVLEKTDRKVYLIPHVTGMTWNDDYLFMKSLLPNISEEGERVVLVPPAFNASQTKWIINKMTMFAGARMHSTIASLSCCVPTLSLAYSMKAKGLNKDIFGHMDYCISAEDLEPDVAAERIKGVLDDSKNIRTYLEQRIPEFKDLAMKGGEILQGIVEQA